MNDNDSQAALDEAHILTEQARANQTADQQRRAEVLAQISATAQSIGAARAEIRQLLSAGKWVEFAKEAGRLAGLRQISAELASGLKYWDCYPAADGERALLVAIHTETKATHSSELSRRDAHRGRVLEHLGSVAEFAGELEVTDLGPLAEAHDELVSRAARGCAEAAALISQHDHDTALSRREFEAQGRTQ